MISRSPIDTLRDEEGIALPVALGVLMIILLITGVVFQQGVISNGAANDDRRVKRAVQAADAGIDVAIFRSNKVPAGSAPCPVVDASGGGTGYAAYVASGGESWCPAVVEDLGQGAQYSYRVSAITSGVQTIVSTGTVGGVSRRVAVKRSGTGVASIFASRALFSDQGVTVNSGVSIANETAGVVAPIASNGNISLNSVSICGNVTPGPGRTVTLNSGSVTCGGSTAAATAAQTVPAVTAGTVATTNDNGRLCNNGDTCNSSASWSSSSRYLSMNTGGSVTLTGNLYLFCGVSMSSGSKLILAPTTGTAVRIYMGGPTECGSSGSFTLNSNAFVTGPGGSTTTRVNSPVLELYGIGDPGPGFYINSKIRVPTGIYAPGSQVTMNDGSEVWGAIAADAVSLGSGSTIVYTDKVSGIQTPGSATTLGTSDYRECSPTAGATPGSNC